jgi:peptide/nickel transport system substrate-binding protein
MRRFVLAFALLAAGCDSKPPATPERVIVYASGDGPDLLDPAATAWGGAAKIMVNLYETLVTFSADGTDLVPGLAEKWEVSADKKTWTFHLRKGVKFHDGTDFDSAAVVFTIQRLLKKSDANPSKEPPYGSDYEDIVGWEAKDALTVTLTTKEPSVVLLQKLAMFPAGVVSPAAVRKAGSEKFALNPVGTGPLMLKSWDNQASKVTLVRNPSYWNGAVAKLDRLIVLEVKDVQTAIEMLRKGDAHVTDKITLSDVAAIEKDPLLRMEYEIGMNVCYLGFNVRKAPYNDVNFRRAVACAVDMKKVIDLAYQGQADAAKSFIPPTIFPTPPGAPGWSYDEAKAKEHLAKVKLPPDFEAQIWHMNWARPYVPEPDKLVQVIKEGLTRIGLKVRLESFGKDIYTSKLRDPDHPMFLLGWSADYADPDNFLFALLHGDSIGPDRAKPSGNNHSFFDHAEFNSLVKAAQYETDGAKRSDMYNRALKIFHDELPVLPVAHVKQMAACRKTVKYNHHPFEYRFWAIEAP